MKIVLGLIRIQKHSKSVPNVYSYHFGWIKKVIKWIFCIVNQVGGFFHLWNLLDFNRLYAYLNIILLKILYYYILKIEIYLKYLLNWITSNSLNSLGLNLFITCSICSSPHCRQSSPRVEALHHHRHL